MTEGVYGLLGENGAGKSTLLNILAGLMPATSGSIDYCTEDSRSYLPELSYLPQKPGFFEMFTALEYLTYLGHMIQEGGMPETKFLELLAAVNLQDVKDKKIKSFSGGMKQRLGIASAFLRDSSVILLDEPMSGLDVQERIRFRNLIAAHSLGKIIVISTHIVSDVAMTAKEILMLKKGRLQKQASPTALLRELKGKLWTLNTSPEFYEKISQDFLVTNVREETNQLEIKLIADERPCPEALPALATLEDVSIYYFSEVF